MWKREQEMEDWPTMSDAVVFDMTVRRVEMVTEMGVQCCMAWER